MEKEKLISTVLAAQKGDAAAVSALYEAYQKDIYYHILKNVDNDAELAADLTQETFIEILETLDRLAEPAAFVTWSQRIAYHKCTAYFRKRREILADEDDDGYSVFDTLVEERSEFIPGEELDKAALREAIQGIVDNLPAEQRSAVVLRYFNEIPVKQIAEIQGVNENTVKSRLNYGRKAIQDGVEKYEKKHGIKLHCAGVIPLLLWLLREYKRANGISLAASVPVAQASVAASASASVAATGASASAAVAGSSLAKTIVAVVAAAALTVAGVAAGIALLPEDKPSVSATEPEQTISSQPPSAPADAPGVETDVSWYGYGSGDRSYGLPFTSGRFDLFSSQRTDTYISGFLSVTYLYEEEHSTSFEGIGESVDGKIQYDITFAKSIYSDSPSHITAVYDPQEDTLSFVGTTYNVTLRRSHTADQTVLAETAKWSHTGSDYGGLSKNDTLFELFVHGMTGSEMTGKLLVTKNDEIKHDSTFTGRGYEKDGEFRYEIRLDTPRVIKGISTVTIETFWLIYSPEEDTFKFSGVTYSGTLTREP